MVQDAKNKKLLELIEGGARGEKMSSKMQGIVDIIINGADPNFDRGKPLSAAINLSRYEYVPVLVESGAIVTEHHISLIGGNYPSSMQKHTKEWLINKMNEQKNNENIEQAKDSVTQEPDKYNIKTPDSILEHPIESKYEYMKNYMKDHKKDYPKDYIPKQSIDFSGSGWYEGYLKNKQSQFKIWNKKYARLKNI